MILAMFNGMLIVVFFLKSSVDFVFSLLFLMKILSSLKLNDFVFLVWFCLIPRSTDLTEWWLDGLSDYLTVKFHFGPIFMAVVVVVVVMVFCSTVNKKLVVIVVMGELIFAHFFFIPFSLSLFSFESFWISIFVATFQLLLLLL